MMLAPSKVSQPQPLDHLRYWKRRANHTQGTATAYWLQLRLGTCVADRNGTCSPQLQSGSWLPGAALKVWTALAPNLGRWMAC